MADRKPTKTGICSMDLVGNPKYLLQERLNRCEAICEHYSYCQHVSDMQDLLKEREYNQCQ